MFGGYIGLLLKRQGKKQILFATVTYFFCMFCKTWSWKKEKENGFAYDNRINKRCLKIALDIKKTISWNTARTIPI